VDLRQADAPGRDTEAPGTTASGAAAAQEASFIPGISQALPPGERLLWWGKPARGPVARHVFHTTGITVYFIVMLVIWAVNRAGSEDFLRTGLIVTALSAAAVSLLWLYAHLVHATTVYAITNKRIVMKIGVALDLTLNIPLHYVQAADQRVFRDGSGQIAVALPREQRLAYAILWPHARAWRLKHPEPMLRGLQDPAAVAAVLTKALQP
jgi:hypothetical protein